MKQCVLAVGILAMFSSAFAQEAPKPSSETPAVSTPDSANPAAPMPGENSFTEAQAKERIEAKGYSTITALTKGQDGIWTASAIKDGKPFEVKLDFQGNIVETAK